MQRGQRSTIAMVLRVVTLSVLVVAGLVLVSEHAATRPAASGEQQVERRVDSEWRAAYSRRFPDCVAVVLWPRTETPAALVVRTGDGHLHRVGLRPRTSAEVLAVLRQSRLVGACRAG